MNEALAWFEDNIDHCLDYAEQAKSEGRPIVGIMCEYAPRELILAAGGVAVCLCGGSAKTIPAAEEVLPTNLCPLIKSTFGYHVTGSNPFLEMADLVVAETTCDGKKKMFELMARTRPVHLMELPHKQDAMLRERGTAFVPGDTGQPKFPQHMDQSDALGYWLTSMHKLKADLESRFGVEITDQKLRDAISTMNRERSLRRSLAELMKSDSPPLTGRQLLEFKSAISAVPADLEMYEKALEGFSLIGQDMLSCPSKLGADLQSAPSRPTAKPRVLLTGVPVVRGAERVVDIIESTGSLIVCQENCTGLKPILEDVEEHAADPMRALAEKYFRVHCAVMTPNARRFDYLRKLAREYRAQCIIDLVWQACQIYDVEAHSVRKLAEDELGIPYLRIETDYSPSDSARIAVRVEALFETLAVGKPCQ